jgi:hypothetical protein
MYVSPPGRREEGVGECIECIDCIKNPEGGKREGSCICMSPGEEGKKRRGRNCIDGWSRYIHHTTLHLEG